MLMTQTMRWFGPSDPVRLAEIRQTGAVEVVTALHEVANGDVWTLEAITARKTMVEAAGLAWTVVESLPVHERIKLGEGDLEPLLDNYRQSLRNLAACGVTTVCYNFMPVLDWTRTDLRSPLPGGGRALRFDAAEFAAFDCFMLERPGAEADHPPEVMPRARAWFDASSEADRRRLLDNIMAGLPGAFDRYDIPGLRRMLDRYSGTTRDALRERLASFLRAVIPAAEEAGVRMCVHPDDPPRPTFGLPRIVSNADDLDFVVGACASNANGITFCTGSLGAGRDNDVPAMARRFAGKVHFAHLRNVAKEPDGSFEEADHLGGDVDMVPVVTTLLEEQGRRRDAGDPRWRIPFRPDHGHELLDDIGKAAFPGYSAIGRLRGLAEIRGVMTAMASLRGLPV